MKPVPEFGKMRRRIILFLILTIALAFRPSPALGEMPAAVAAIGQSNAILWKDPTDIASRNLYYGPGGEENQPKEPLYFVKEDMKGTNPKFDVRDQAGTKWKVKLGIEARPETVATRLLWAVGFISNENYFLAESKVNDLPARLKRGQKLVETNGDVRAVRLQKPPCGKKAGIWHWKHNPFTGSRELNGLRVMMALFNNWDLKDINNAIYANCDESGAVLYEVSDLGASFGMTGESYTHSMSKNNLRAYQRSKFISKIGSDFVSFNFPTHLPYLYVFNLRLFVAHQRLRWIGRHIPRSDAKWIASYLAKLSPQQIRDAFRAAGYSAEQVEAYTTTVQARIAELERL
jgi:hypothetical protein